MYEELKKLAEELDGEEWLLVDGEGFEADNRFITSQRRIDDNKVGYAEINYGHPDAGMAEPFQSRQVSAGKFIAAANPSAVLALIADLVKIDADRKACWAEFKVQGRYIDQLRAESEELVTALNEILRVTPMGVEAFDIAALVLGELGVSKDADQ